MIELFYALGADWNLKPVFLSPIPKEISQAVEKSLQNWQRKVVDVTFGEIQ